MKLNQLRLLVAVAQAGSIQKAARASHISQPALSKAIRDLEHELGVSLLVRSAGGATLTPYGAIVVKRMTAVEKEIGHIRDEIDWLRGEVGGQVAIGLSPTAAGHAVAAAIARFASEQPAIGIQLLEQRPAQIVEGLRTGRLDLGIMHHYGASRLPDFPSLTLKSFDTALAISGRHAEGQISLEALGEKVWLAGDLADDPDGHIAVLMRKHGLPQPPRIVRCSSIGLYAELARQMDVVSHWAEPALAHLESRFRAGAMTRLFPDRRLPRMQIALTFQDEALLSPAAATLVRSLRALAATEGAWL